MKRYLGYGFFGLTIYVLALVMLLPAQQVLPRAAGYLQGHGLQIGASGLRGSIWSGGAAHATVNGRELGRSEWSVSPFSLLLGTLSMGFRVEPEGGYVGGDVQIASQSLRLEGVEGRLPASTLLQFLPPFPLPVVLEGNVSMRIDELAMQGGKTEAASGVILWSQAGLAGPAAMRLGDLKLELSPGTNGNLVGKLSDGGGPLSLRGDVTITPERSYRLNANLSTRTGADPTLSQALAMLGRPDNKGGYTVTWAGRL